MFGILQNQNYGLLQQRTTHYFVKNHNSTGKLHRLNVYGQRPNKITAQLSYRVVLARSNIKKTYLRRVANETLRPLSLFNPCTHYSYTTIIFTSNRHQLKPREPINANSRRQSSMWKMYNNFVPRTRNSWTIVIRFEHRRHWPLRTTNAIVQMLSTLYRWDCTTTKYP